MAKTLITDVIQPAAWEGYVIERTAELAEFAQAGIVEADPAFDELAGQGGLIVNMPFWQDLSASRQILSDSGDLTVNKISGSQDAARIHRDGNAWSVNVLAKWLSGDDPMAAIGDLVADYWGRIDEDMLVASLVGLELEFDSISGDPNLLKIASESIASTTDATRLNGTTFIDALQKLGDRNSRLSACAIHSATEAYLKKLDLIDYVPDSEGKAQIATFQGRRVVVDDDLSSRAGTTDGTVYRSILFGMGAFAKGASPLAGEPLEGGFGTEGVELARVALSSDSVLINRRQHILHPRGVKWVDGSVAGTSPTDAELALAANWTKVYESKNIRIVIVQHNLQNAS